MSKLNPEGLTFEEWVCAAALVNYSYDLCLLRYSECIYPDWVRTAWLAGEDPTEYRAPREAA